MQFLKFLQTKSQTYSGKTPKKYLPTINVNLMVKISGYDEKVYKIRVNFEITGVETKFIHLKFIWMSLHTHEKFHLEILM